MQERLLSWWKIIKQHRVAVGVGAIVFVAVIVLIIVGYWFDWTGFSGYNKVTTTHIISGTNAGTVTRTEEYQPGKALWDWLGLLGILAIPVVAGIGAAWFTAQQGKVSERENKDNQREKALQDYIDKISELLLKEHLDDRTADSKLNPEYEQVRNVARVRTITVLTQLDARRISYVFAFLREAGLMLATSNDNVVSLSHTDLRGVNWSQATLYEANLRAADLRGADLRGADLSIADLKGADLRGADLSDADLFNADLFNADLRRANLSKATTFSKAHYSEASNFRGANFRGANLEKADLTGASLSKADLTGAHLWLAHFSDADLTDTDLTGAGLTHADLTGANLEKADLTGADLIGADLTGANLKGITGISVEKLERQTKSLEGAIMPDGSKHQ